MAPIAPEKLKIARLASRLGDGESAERAAASRAGVARVAVQLNRAQLPVDDDPMHFRLKMALLRGLRRRFRYSLIEVDDAPPGVGQSEPFLVEVEPAAALPVEQARAVVARVLRRRKWRDVPAEDDSL
ncbi:hypothetical protein [Thioalkalivibrio sp. XN279]|uniref:hypothetical protein n=1 Tax=Thioalkalivibrio sp. XN279 TaxID=2714953 RepID=UPI0014079E33|nr:hypothetical protein [Thioalkalivibrio sp. XN279]NHA14712.1 hypothetical protein [Thioalkalivibrio sp. XN279]